MRTSATQPAWASVLYGRRCAEFSLTAADEFHKFVGDYGGRIFFGGFSAPAKMSADPDIRRRRRPGSLVCLSVCLSVWARCSGCLRSASSSLASRRRGLTAGHTGFWPPTSWTPSIDCSTPSCDDVCSTRPRVTTPSWTSSACPLTASRGRWTGFTWTRDGTGSSCPTCCRPTAVPIFCRTPPDIARDTS